MNIVKVYDAKLIVPTVRDSCTYSRSTPFQKVQSRSLPIQGELKAADAVREGSKSEATSAKE
jgi:hypothetical protein